jgi:hypothetical protein
VSNLKEVRVSNLEIGGNYTVAIFQELLQYLLMGGVRPVTPDSFNIFKFRYQGKIVRSLRAQHISVKPEVARYVGDCPGKPR